MADANETRDWRIYRDFAQILIHEARRLYAKTIDLCLSVFPWAQFRKTKSAIKMHTLLDLRGNIPTFIWITDGKVHDVNVLDHLIPEPGAIYIMDRAYLDFQRLYHVHQNAAFFVTRSKANTKLRRLYSQKVDKTTDVKCDQIVVPSGFYSQKKYPDKLRRIKFLDAQNAKTLTLLTNQLTLPAATIAELYRCRWQVEIFFKWIKQHLRIKNFFGTSENAVKSQIWIAISTYVLIAIMKKNLNVDLTLYTILQILSISLFEKKPIYQVWTGNDYKQMRVIARPN